MFDLSGIGKANRIEQSESERAVKNSVAANVMNRAGNSGAFSGSTFFGAAGFGGDAGTSGSAAGTNRQRIDAAFSAIEAPALGISSNAMGPPPTAAAGFASKPADPFVAPKKEEPAGFGFGGGGGFGGGATGGAAGFSGGSGGGAGAFGTAPGGGFGFGETGTGAGAGAGSGGFGFSDNFPAPSNAFSGSGFGSKPAGEFGWGGNKDSQW